MPPRETIGESTKPSPIVHSNLSEALNYAERVQRQCDHALSQIQFVAWCIFSIVATGLPTIALLFRKSVFVPEYDGKSVAVSLLTLFCCVVAGLVFFALRRYRFLMRRRRTLWELVKVLHEASQAQSYTTSAVDMLVYKTRLASLSFGE